MAWLGRGWLPQTGQGCRGLEGINPSDCPDHLIRNASDKQIGSGLIRILLKSHSINYRDREGLWLLRILISLHQPAGETCLGLLCDLGYALPSLGLLCIGSNSTCNPLFTQDLFLLKS